MYNFILQEECMSRYKELNNQLKMKKNSTEECLDNVDNGNNKL